MTAYAALEARIEIVRSLLAGRRVTYMNAALLLGQAAGEFSSREAALTQPLPDLAHQLDNDRLLLRSLRTTAQTASATDASTTCSWRRALIVCRPAHRDHRR